MSHLRWPVCFALASLVVGCARPMRDIEPNFVDANRFAGASCSQLVAERARRARALIFSGLQQDQISQDDRTRTLGAPTPMGTLFEDDVEPEIARLKGELRAIDTMHAIMNCGSDYR